MVAKIEEHDNVRLKVRGFCFSFFTNPASSVVHFSVPTRIGLCSKLIINNTNIEKGFLKNHFFGLRLFKQN